MNKGIGGFIRGIGNEMKKVSWPGREQLQESTIVTIATCVIIMAFLFVIDFALAQLFSFLFKLV